MIIFYFATFVIQTLLGLSRTTNYFEETEKKKKIIVKHRLDTTIFRLSKLSELQLDSESIFLYL